MAIVIRVSYSMKPGKRAELIKFVQENVEQTRREKGNLEYAHYPSLENEEEMFVFEHWETMEDVYAHIKAPHYLDFSKKRGPLMETYHYTVFDSTAIQEGDRIETW